MKNRIIIADNETTISEFIKKIIEFDKSNNADVDVANDINTFNNYLKANQYSLIIIDLAFGNKNVNEFISKYSSENPYTPIIAISANIDINLAMTSMRLGAYDFISKPFTSDTMMLVVKNAIEKRQLLIEKEELNKDLTSANDELFKANNMITIQKEQLNNYVKKLKEEIDKMKNISIETGKVKSFETNQKIIFEQINDIYKPKSSVLMMFEKTKKKFIVKFENNFQTGFEVGTEMEFNTFKKFFNNNSVSTDSSINAEKDDITVIIPLESGNMILGLILMTVNLADFNEDHLIFYEILRYMLTISMLNSRFLEDSRRSYIESLMAFLILEERVHRGIKKHSEMVAATSVKLAKTLKLDDSDIRNLQYAGLLHLLGLIEIPHNQLSPKNYLDPVKGLEIRKAILKGTQILAPLVFMEQAREIIEDLFENYDGSGIPGGKKGKEIRIPSRILRVVGDYYALKNIFKMDGNDIIKHLKDNNKKMYDPDILQSFFNIFVKH